MKKLLIVLMTMTPLLGLSQVAGNKKIITKTIPLSNLKIIEMGLYADLEVSASGIESLEITIDENLLEKVNLEMEGNKLHLVQKEWIQPSEKIKIRINAPELTRLNQSVHETTRISELDQQSFNAMATVGTIQLKGTVNKLSASGEIGTVDARDLKIQNLDVNIWDQGEVLIQSAIEISGTVKGDGVVKYNQGNPKIRTSGSGKVLSEAELETAGKPDVQWINFKLKNNSLNRINCYVVGPKPDGKRFSYGFPMNPGQTRVKDWTTGSKVYRVTRVGTRQLLKEIVPTDADKTVELFEN